MPTRSAFALILSLALVTTACSSPMKTPDFKQNPHPVKRYEITMSIEGAPGPFDSVEGYVLYQVAEDACLPLQPGSGARLALRKDIPIVFEGAGDKTYKAVIYTDLMHDEDYFGLGVCHWKVASSGTTLKVKNLSFITDMGFDEIRAQKPAVTYFTKRSYSEAQAGTKNTDTGTIRTAYVEEHTDEFFSVTLTTKENY